ncbi:farnesol dehydrogenase [Musca domestica]|uniref:Farnesol dehydrogenase n=1 Tax=Musca domestica TaxID=7370 RepID=A0A1I8M3N4_MUSDO|nr:farnesol dehydrogenase [Musca domestica]
MERWQDCVAVVTGASSGIGEAIVKDLLKAKENIIVVGLARRLERMEDYKAKLQSDQKSRFHPLECDVSSKASVDQAFDHIICQLGRVDILVNNAGIFKLGQLSTIDAEIPQQVLQTNVMGVFYCTQRAFKSMRERQFDGHVVIINSNLGHKIPSSGDQPPYMNMYGPSKYAVTAMTELYRQEFKGLGTKIKITSISPGLTATEIVPEEYRSGKYPIMQPEDISSCVMFTLSTPARMQIHEMLVEPNGAP